MYEVEQLIGGTWVPGGAGAQTDRARTPPTASRSPASRSPPRPMSTPRSKAARDAAPGWAATAAGTPRPPRCTRPPTRSGGRRRARRAHVRRDGQAGRRRPRLDRGRRRHAAPVRRTRPDPPRPRAGRQRRRDRPDGVRAARRRRGDHAVERPGRGLLRPARRGPGHRQHRRVQAERAHARPPAGGSPSCSPRTSRTACSRCSTATARSAPRWPRADVDVVAHVGSTATGRAIAAACARTGAKALLENGGSDPLIVDAGVDPAWAAEQAALGRVRQLRPDLRRGRADLRAPRASPTPFLDGAGGRGRGRWAGDLGPLVDRRLRDAVHAQVPRRSRPARGC